MPTPNASISYDSSAARTAADARSRDKNRLQDIHMVPDPFAHRKPEFYVGIFNVNTKPLTVPRQWGMGQQVGDTGVPSISGLVTIPGRDPDELYSKPVILRDIEHMQKLQPGSDEIILVPVSGEFLAQDLCNCADPYGSWKTYQALNPATRTSDGANYYERGVFWVRLATPESEPDFDAVDFAIKQLEHTYQLLVEEGNRLYQSGPKGQTQICDSHHEAVEYFIQAGNTLLDLPWHATLKGGLSGKLKQAMAARKAAEPK